MCCRVCARFEVLRGMTEGVSCCAPLPRPPQRPATRPTAPACQPVTPAPLPPHCSCSFTAVTSIATIGLYISYVIPVLLRCTVARRTFRPGPFSLGRLSIPVGCVAILWVAFITILFVLPTGRAGRLFPGPTVRMRRAGAHCRALALSLARVPAALPSPYLTFTLPSLPQSTPWTRRT